MVEIILAFLLLVLLVLQIAVLARPRSGGESASLLREGFERSERGLRDEMERGRREAGESAKALRAEIVDTMTKLAASVKEDASRIAANLEVRHGELRTAVEKRLVEERKEAGERLASFGKDQGEGLAALTRGLAEQREALSRTLEERFKQIDLTVRGELEKVRAQNESKLEEMRKTVDEKLQESLDRKLGESFRQVSDRLEMVHKGLGEMQTLAVGVGDLRKVLTNVKSRGVWGEVALGNLLDQILPPQHVVKNAHTGGERRMVEYAVKLPGRGGEDDRPVLLPIDAKFPIEDWTRLVEESENGTRERIEEISKALEARVKAEAKEISQKYVHPPETTDFAILYLPIEGLYAEILRRPGLVEFLQRELRITVAGPTTLAALLNSLGMGFKTLAIEKRTSEVWEILSAVRKKFRDFADTFTKAQNKIREAGEVLEKAQKDTRLIDRKFRDVEVATDERSRRILGVAPEAEADDAT